MTEMVQYTLTGGIVPKKPKKKCEMHVYLTVRSHTITEDARYCKDTFKSDLTDAALIITDALSEVIPIQDLVALRSRPNDEILETISSFFNPDI